MFTGGRICTFSPCIEQVQKTHDVLKENGFEDCSTVECLVRNFDVRTVNLALPCLGNKEEVMDENPLATSPDSSSNKDSGDLNDKDDQENKKIEVKKEENNATSKYLSYNLVGRKTEDTFQFKSGVPSTTMPGHTGYLTFAALYL